MIVSGVVSGVKNMCAVVAGEKDLDEAAVDVTKTVAKDGATAYSVANIGTGIKALMHASKNELIRELGASAVNLPVLLANTTVSVGKNLYRFAKGEINSEELVYALGQNGMELTLYWWNCWIGIRRTDRSCDWKFCRNFNFKNNL